MPTLNKTNFSSKEYLIKRLENHENLHDVSRLLYTKYCSLSGFLHLLPDFYIIGAQKSGTTSLFYYLTKHPNIPQTIKDIRFFDKYYHKGLDWYRLHFPLKISKSVAQKINRKKYVIGEATERYLEYPHAPQRIKKITPNAKFLIVLRNPVERTYSHYNMNLRLKHETLPFEERINNVQSRIQEEYEKMEKDETYYSDEYFRYAYLDRSIYIDKIKRWMKIFPKEQFMVVENKELSKKTSRVYNDVLEFLNLPALELNEYKKFYLAKYKQPTMEPEIRKKLIEFFKPYNEKLYKFLDIDYGWN